MILQRGKTAGFTLVEVMIVVGLLTIVSLGMAQFIVGQGKQISAMEDRMTRMQLDAEIRQIFNNREQCLALLGHTQLRADQEISPVRIMNDMGRVLFDPQQEENTYDHLRLLNAGVRNLSVQKGQLTGEVEVMVQVERMRQGGGPQQLAPIQVRFPVVIDKKSFIRRCYPKRAPICSDTIILQAGKLPNPSKDFRNCCDGGGNLNDCVTTGLEQTPVGNSIFYICSCEP